MATAYRFGKKPEDVEVRFRRDLGLLEITMIGLGPTVGTTIFLLVGPGLAMVGPALLLVFVLNFVVTCSRRWRTSSSAPRSRRPAAGTCG